MCVCVCVGSPKKKNSKNLSSSILQSYYTITYTTTTITTNHTITHFRVSFSLQTLRFLQPLYTPHTQTSLKSIILYSFNIFSILRYFLLQNTNDEDDGKLCFSQYNVGENDDVDDDDDNGFWCEKNQCVGVNSRYAIHSVLAIRIINGKNEDWLNHYCHHLTASYDRVQVIINNKRFYL